MAFAILALASFVAAACSSGDGGDTSTNGGGLASDQTLVLNIGGEPSSIDPSRVDDIDSANVSAAIFSGLVKITGEDNEVVPVLAEEVPEPTEDGTVYTFRLKDDITWSNGDPITAEDFKTGFFRSIDPELSAGLAYEAFDVVGAAEYNDPDAKGSKEAKAAAVGVRVIDDQTIEYTLTSAKPWFPQLAALPIFYPVHGATIQKAGETKWTEPETIVTSGAFKLEEWEHRQSMTLVKNEDFVNADDVALEQIDVKMVGDPKTAFNQFKGDQLDAGFRGTMIDISDLDEAKQLPEYIEVPVLATQYIWMNSKKPALADVKVREAITRAVDRTTLTEEITQGGQLPITTIAPPGLSGYDTFKEGHQDNIDPDGEVDDEKVASLLEEGDFKEGTSLSVYYTIEGGNGKAVAEFLQDDLKKHGINLKLVPQPEARTLYELATPPIDPKVDIVLLGWIADFDDPFNFYGLFTCDSSSNVSQLCDEDYDKIVDEMGKTADDSARFELAKEAEGKLTGPDGIFPAAPLYRDTDRTLAKEYVKNFAFSPLGLLDLSAVEIEDH